MLLDKFAKLKLISPPPWLLANTHMVVEAGSVSYGTNNQNSDIDLFGFATPKLEMVFPAKFGYIEGLGTKPPKFERYEQQFEFEGKQHDIKVLGIIHFANLCWNNNPDMLDTLFVSHEHLRHITTTGQIIRDNRHKFLSKRVYDRYRGYSFAQLNKSEKNRIEGKRLELTQKFGYDPKFLSHAVRLLYECHQILTEGNLDLKRNSDHIKAVKTGIVGLDEVKKWYGEFDIVLTKAMAASSLPDEPNELEIKKIVLACLENHYGKLENCVTLPGWEADKLRRIQSILDEV